MPSRIVCYRSKAISALFLAAFACAQVDYVSGQDDSAPKAKKNQKAPRDRVIGARRGDDAQRIAAGYRRTWEAERFVLARICEVDEETRAKMTEALLPKFLNLADATLKNQTTNVNYQSPVGMPEALKQVVLETVGKSVAPKLLQRYESDLRARSKFIEESVLSATIVVLYDLLSLDPDQLAKAEPILRKNYTGDWYAFSQGFGTPEFSAETDKAISAILTEKQLVAWKEKAVAQTRMAIPIPGNGVADALEQKQNDLFRRSLAAIVEARVEMLTRVFKLNKKQVSKVNVLASGVQQEIVRKRMNARRELQSRMREPNAIPNPATIEYANGSPATLLSSEQNWLMYLEKVLTAEQRVQYKALSRQRQLMGKTQMAQMFVLSMGSRLSLSADQMKQMATLLEESLPDHPVTRLSPALIRAIVDLPEPKVRAILGEEQNMATWNQQMDDGRRMLAQLEAAMEADKADKSQAK